MHGRVKVKTTEQQQKEKKIERDAKLKSYRKAMSTLLARRAQGCKDDLQLQISAQVLQSNPDISTLWNFRKETLLHNIQPELAAAEKKENSEGDSEKTNTIDKDSLLDKELDLTQQCLMANPKSYGSWHHRTWVLEHMDQPDWNRELNLCQRYLKLDERNFHCWDYRKWVASKAGVPPCSELDFTREKIDENFSNYSAWHYRSKLLPLVHPGEGNSSIKEETIHAELDLVQNAAFTDPEDSSAWFYHTWLLGRAGEKTSIVFILLENGLLTLSFTKPVKRCDILVMLEESEVELDLRGEEEHTNTLWTSKVTWSSGSQVKIMLGEETSCFKVEGSRQLVPGPGWKTTENRFVNLPTEKTSEVLKQALDNCNQLLELEPDSKWTLYTRVLILLAIDSQANHKDIVGDLATLGTIDSMRKNFYSDLGQRLQLEYRIEKGSTPLLQSTQSAVQYHKQYLPAFSNLK